LAKPLSKDKEFLQQKYCIEGLSLAQIAEGIGSSKEAVRGGLRSFGIGLRLQGQHHGHPSQPRFGTQIIKGRTAPHLGELRISQMVSRYHADGLSLRKIASMLNKQKIPTKTRRGSWHPEMVSRLLVS
jgi:hypothetical protein